MKMPRTPRKMEKGFTLLEVVIVLAIFGITMAIAVFSYQNNIDRYRLDGDVRSLETHLQEARLRAISQNMNVGIVFARRDGDSQGDTPDCYYIFVDAAGGGAAGDEPDGLFTTTSTPENNFCEDTDQTCKDTMVASGLDPVITGALPKNNNPGLNAGEYFSRILQDKTDTGGGSPAYVSLIFTPLGEVLDNTGNTLSGTPQQRSICIQNHAYTEGSTNQVQTKGIVIQGTTGNITLLPTRMVRENLWECVP